MVRERTLDHLDRLIAERSILGHPFYVAWRSGALTLPQIAAYARIYYPHVAAFPGYLQKAIDGAANPAVRAELARNLVDEQTTPKAHRELWLDFAEQVGADRRQVAGAVPEPAAARAVTAFTRLVESGTPRALAALYAYEAQQPEVSREKASSLRCLYGVDSPTALAYFEVHAEADCRHRAGERAALGECLNEAVTASAQILESADEALTAYWGLLDGVCAVCGIPQ